MVSYGARVCSPLLQFSEGCAGIQEKVLQVLRRQGIQHGRDVKVVADGGAGGEVDRLQELGLQHLLHADQRGLQDHLLHVAE